MEDGRSSTGDALHCRESTGAGDHCALGITRGGDVPPAERHHAGWDVEPQRFCDFATAGTAQEGMGDGGVEDRAMGEAAPYDVD
jgi:hypothetical protein